MTDFVSDGPQNDALCPVLGTVRQVFRHFGDGRSESFLIPAADTATDLNLGLVRILGKLYDYCVHISLLEGDLAFHQI